MSDDLQKLRGSYEDRVRALNDTVRQRERELVILSQVAARIHGEDEVQRIFDIALEEILDRLELKAAWIFTGDQREQKLRLTASRGVAAKYLEDVRQNGLTECLCPEVFWSGHRMQARNTTQCPRMPDIIAGLRAPVAHACIPLKLEGTTRGVLNVAAPVGHVFSEEQLRFLDTLGHQIAIAVERARHREAERLRDQEARAITAISKAVGGSLEVEEVLEAVGRTALEVLGAERVLILLGSDVRAMRVGHLTGSAHPELKSGDTVDLEHVRSLLLMRCLRTREAASVDDWYHEQGVNHELARRWDMGSGIVAPLMARGRTLGLVAVTCSAPRHWSPQNLDLAEALAAQAAVALENARLYEETRRSYQELKDAQERIIRSEKMAVLGTFASGLAHEVRNPLNSMALQLSILERRIGKVESGLSEEMAELASVIRDEIKRLDELVSDFLLFSRSGNRLPARSADLEELVDDVVRLLRPEGERVGVQVDALRLPEPAPPLAADSERLKQVVINLVRNAIEAMPDGGRVVVETGLVEGRARLVVRDTGPGLPDGLDVFQLFVTTKPKGTGLGLSIVQQIVLEHGGEITAGSEPGQGATFTITLPLAPLSTAEAVSA